MATNGDSARKWLDENRDKVSMERIRQIRDNITARLQKADDADESYSGLLEALDVMDSHLLENELPAEDAQNSASFLDSLMDSGPLIEESQEVAPQLSSEEKQLRFRKLLKTGKI